MWPFINKVYDAPNGGWALFICFVIVVGATEGCVRAWIKRRQ
jgi:hypothetical protein